MNKNRPHGYNGLLIVIEGTDGSGKSTQVNMLSKYILRPRYDIYGRIAPLKRNEEMVDIADGVLVIWDGHSKGSEYTIKYAKKTNKAVTVIII